MCYALARLYEETRNIVFLEAAEKGANYLISVAVGVKNGRLIPHHLPYHPDDDLYYVSFCHGPAGTGRLFVLLYRLTGNQIYKEFYYDLAQGIIGIGAPEYHSAGYWNCHCQCCGTAGFLSYFLGIWLESGKEEYLQYAVRSGKVLLGSATYRDGRSVWYQAFMRTNPGSVDAVLGYSEGAAGIGVALTHLASALDGKFKALRLPDDPFKAER
jgi:lantibiotic modifying enzyme